jgi:hypothetical protein
MVPLFAGAPERDRKRWGLRVCRVEWLLGLSIREYPELEAGTRFPTTDTYDAMCDLFGWSQRFVEGAAESSFDPKRRPGLACGETRGPGRPHLGSFMIRPVSPDGKGGPHDGYS